MEYIRVKATNGSISKAAESSQTAPHRDQGAGTRVSVNKNSLITYLIFLAQELHQRCTLVR
jgi:hypothetical protein